MSRRRNEMNPSKISRPAALNDSYMNVSCWGFNLIWNNIELQQRAQLVCKHQYPRYRQTKQDFSLKRKVTNVIL